MFSVSCMPDSSLLPDTLPGNDDLCGLPDGEFCESGEICCCDECHTTKACHCNGVGSRYEKAVDFADSGSVTILAVTTMPDDDITHPVPDNTGYITEGQLYLKNGKIDPFASLSRLKQLVNKDTRKDHRALMDAMIKLYAQCSESREKKSLGFEMSTWDEKLLKYGLDFEERLMSLEVNLDVISALNTGWEILAANFDKNEVGIRSDLISEFWLVTENV